MKNSPPWGLGANVDIVDIPRQTIATCVTVRPQHGIVPARQGEGLEETGSRADTGAVVVRIDPRYFRPTEVELLVGDATKAKERLGWTPSHTLEQLCSEMVASDLALFKRDKYLLDGGHDILNQHEA